MTDAATKKVLRVSPARTGRALIDVSVQHLDELERLLKANGVYYWVHEQFISFDGGPEMAMVNLGPRPDVQAVQALLDSVA